jgi:spermidine synthase
MASIMDRKTIIPAALAFGAFCQIGQVLLLREFLTVFQGSELTIGLMLGAWMVWVGIGSRLGAVISVRSRRPDIVLDIVTAAAVLILPVTLAIVRTLRIHVGAQPGVALNLHTMIASSFLLPAPVCILLGALFVLIVRLMRSSSASSAASTDPSPAATVYWNEAAGNMVGGVLFTFFMASLLNAFQSAVLAGIVVLPAILLMTGIAGKRTLQKAPGRDGWYRAVLWAVPAVALIGFVNLSDLDTRISRSHWQNFMPRHELVESRPSKHGAVTVMRMDDQMGFYQSGHLVFVAAGRETLQPGFEDQEAAVFAHFAMTQHRAPKRVLLVGGGLRGTLREIALHSVEHIDYVELDRVLTDVAVEYLPDATLRVLQDSRVRLIHADARAFIKQTDTVYDLIMVDAPDPATAALNRFYTLEFFREAHQRLASDGAMIVHADSTPNLRGAAIANRNASIYHTLGRVFERVMVAGNQPLFYLAANKTGHISIDPVELLSRYKARDIESDGFRDAAFDLLLRQPQLNQTNRLLAYHGRDPNARMEGAEPAPLRSPSPNELFRIATEWPPVHEPHFINSDFRPVAYYYTLMFLDDLTGGRNRQIFRYIMQVRAWWIMPPLFMILVAGAPWHRISRRFGTPDAGRRTATLFAVFTTGFSTMALQIALLFTFQSVYGFVYEMVGLIVALFMCGLAVGVILIQSLTTNLANLKRLAGMQGVIALFSILIAIILPLTAAIPSPSLVFTVFALVTFFAGLINGIDFPLATACCMAQRPGIEKNAAAVYGMELFGAFTGSIIAGVAIAPVLGIAACAYMAAIVNAAAGVILWGHRT